MKQFASDKIQEIDGAIAGLELQRVSIEKQAREAPEKGIEKWLGFAFESSSGRTPEYSAFVRDYRREMKKMLAGSFEMLPKTSDAHFEASGFVRNLKTKKLAYWSISDIRYFSDSWYNCILIRTAKHDKDWTGGRNNNTDWQGLLRNLLAITK